jgi:hypothetical protein
MELNTQLGRLVTNGEFVDASYESQAVFGKGILAVVSVQVVEALNSCVNGHLVCSNSPVEELLLDIRRGFGSQLFLKDVADIREFLGRGTQTYVAVPELLDYLVLVVPMPTITTLFVCGPEESPEKFGIRW